MSNSNLDKKIQLDLSYSPIPLSLLLNRNSEVFLCEGERTIPLSILKPGLLFGMFETMDFMFNRSSSPIWNVSAGLRSVFMLPKVNELSGVKRLKKHYHISSDAQLKYLTDHWQVFKEISRSPIFSTFWKSEVLFFTRPWFTKKNDPKWFNLHRFLFKKSWEQVQYAIHELQTGPLWKECVQTIVHRRLKPTPYLIDTVKHLVTIAYGLAPGFVSASSDLELPLTELQRAFTEIYLLNRYVPSILCPSFFSNSNKIIYYSLAFPTLPYNFSQKINPASYMSDVKMVKLIIDSLIKNHSNYPPFQSTKFEFFHSEKDQENEIKNSRLISQVDPNFSENQQQFSDRYFCTSSSFWHGCIQMMTKNCT